MVDSDGPRFLFLNALHAQQIWPNELVILVFNFRFPSGAALVHSTNPPHKGFLRKTKAMQHSAPCGASRFTNQMLQQRTHGLEELGS